MDSLNYSEISSYGIVELCQFVLAYARCSLDVDCSHCLLGSTLYCTEAVLAVLDEIRSRILTGK